MSVSVFFIYLCSQEINENTEGMSIFQGFIRGIRAYGPACAIMFSRRFSWFFIFPFLFLLLLFAGGEWLTGTAGDSLSSYMQAKVGGWIQGVSWLSWMNGVAGFLIRILTKLLYIYLFLVFGGYVVIVIMSPVYSWLSERTEAHLTGKTYPFSLKQMLWEVMRGIMIALRNLLLQLAISLLLFVCSFIPLVGLLTPVAMFLVSSYFYGFSFVDYAIERRRFNVKKSTAYMKKNAGVVTGVGSVFALALLIPWISILVCCFVSVVSVVAGTVVTEEKAKS